MPDRITTSAAPQTLVEGQRLDQPTFHAIYQAGYIHGPPELVIEVSKATRYVDLGPKRVDYERAGVLEYVVRAIDPDDINWFSQEQGALVQRRLGDDGMYRSHVFPGIVARIRLRC